MVSRCYGEAFVARRVLISLIIALRELLPKTLQGVGRTITCIAWLYLLMRQKKEFTFGVLRNNIAGLKNMNPNLSAKSFYKSS